MKKKTFFDVCAFNFKLIGFWPMQFNSKFLSLIYNVYHFFSIFITCIFIFTQLIEIPNMIQKGFVKLVALGAINAQFVIGMIKFIVLRGSAAQKLIKTVNATEENIFNGEDENVKKLYLSHLNKAHLVNKLWLSLGLICDTIFSFAPWLLEIRYKMLNEEFSHLVVDGYKERPLPLDAWVPVNRFKYYKAVYAWDIVGGVYNTLVIVASDNVYFTFIIFGISQLEILRIEITRAINTSSEAESRSNMRKAIIYHKNIIRYLTELDQVMKGFLLLAVFVYVLQIALISFQIVVEDPSFEMAKNVYYLLAMIVELIIFYWFGNEVYLASIEVIDTIMQTNWYKIDNSTKKTLLFVMMRAEKPLKLSVGPFYHMSTETMLMILKSSISYSAALQTIYTRNKEIHSHQAN